MISTAKLNVKQQQYDLKKLASQLAISLVNFNKK